jgi:hypothetical protein
MTENDEPKSIMHTFWMNCARSVQIDEALLSQLIEMTLVEDDTSTDTVDDSQTSSTDITYRISPLSIVWPSAPSLPMTILGPILVIPSAHGKSRLPTVYMSIQIFEHRFSYSFFPSTRSYEQSWLFTQINPTTMEFGDREIPNFIKMLHPKIDFDFKWLNEQASASAIFERFDFRTQEYRIILKFSEVQTFQIGSVDFEVDTIIISKADFTLCGEIPKIGAIGMPCVEVKVCESRTTLYFSTSIPFDSNRKPSTQRERSVRFCEEEFAGFVPPGVFVGVPDIMTRERVVITGCNCKLDASKKYQIMFDNAYTLKFHWVNGQFSMFENLLTPIDKSDKTPFKSMSRADGCFIVRVTDGIPEHTFSSMQATIEIKCVDVDLSKKLIQQVKKAEPWVMETTKSQDSLLLPFILENVYELTNCDIPFLVPVLVRGNIGYLAEKLYISLEPQRLIEMRVDLREEIIEFAAECADKSLLFTFANATKMGTVRWVQDRVTMTLIIHPGNPKYKFMKKLESIRDTCRSDVCFKFG